MIKETLKGIFHIGILFGGFVLAMAWCNIIVAMFVGLSILLLDPVWREK